MLMVFAPFVAFGVGALIGYRSALCDVNSYGDRFYRLGKLHAFETAARDMKQHAWFYEDARPND